LDERKLFLAGVGEKNAIKIAKAIEESKRVEYDRFITSLGIRYVGEVTAKVLAKRFLPIERLIKATFEELIRVEGIGSVVANSIVSFFKNDNNVKLIEKILSLGVKIIYPVMEKTNISGKTFVVTGTLKNFSRDEIKRVLNYLGCNVSESVSSRTDYVIVGENPGSKYEKAKELGIKILTEEEFIELTGKTLQELKRLISKDDDLSLF
ncbi:MAG: helix-hairpin-helix domain-containing protein, partial [Brevinematia bacterium]